MSAEELILLYVPMPLNADGDGPADPDETVRVEHQLWDADTNTTVFTARDEALALQLMAAWNSRTPIQPSGDTGELRERVAKLINDWPFHIGEQDGANEIADAILDLIQSKRAE